MRFLVLVQLVLALFGSIAPAETVPDGLKVLATAKLGEINDAVASNSYLMTDFGIEDPKQLSRARLDVNRAFAMHRLALERVADAASISGLVEKTPYYYVPYCIAENCPGLAAFTYSEATGQGDFVSIGEALLAKALVETEKRRQELGIDEKAQLVFVSGHQVPMVYHQDAGGQEQLLIGTEKDARETARLVIGNEEISASDRESAKLDVISMEQLAVYARELSLGANRDAPKEMLPVEQIDSVTADVKSESQIHFPDPDRPTNPSPIQSVNSDVRMNTTPSAATNFTLLVVLLSVGASLSVLGWTLLRRK
jgi:hypothetical protein